MRKLRVTFGMAAVFLCIGGPAAANSSKTEDIAEIGDWVQILVPASG